MEVRLKRRVVVDRGSRDSAEPVVTDVIPKPYVEKRGIWLPATHRKTKGGKYKKLRKKGKYNSSVSNKDQEIRKILASTNDKSAYKLYFKTDHWVRLHKRIVRERKACECCTLTHNLQVHHLIYRDNDGSILFREKDKHVLLVCSVCHDKMHAYGMAYGIPKNKEKRAKHFQTIRALPIVDDYIHEIPL